MNEELKYFLYLLGGIAAPFLAYWVWYFVKEKYNDFTNKLGRANLEIISLKEQLNLLQGALDTTRQTVSKELIEVKNEISVYSGSNTEHRYLSDIASLRRSVYEIGLTLQGINKRILKLERHPQRHDSMMHSMYKICCRLVSFKNQVMQLGILSKKD